MSIFILMKQPDLQQTSQHQPSVKTMDKTVISFLNSAQQVGNNKVNVQDNPLYFSLSEHQVEMQDNHAYTSVIPK